MDGEITTWTLSTTEPLVGLYGYESSRGIEALSIITIDEQCQQNAKTEGDETPEERRALEGGERAEGGGTREGVLNIEGGGTGEGV